MTKSLIVDSDVISIVSKQPTKLKEYVKINLPTRFQDCLSGLDEFINGSSLEYGFADGQNLTIVSIMRCLPHHHKYGCGNNINKFIAFLIFHGNGHNAGHTHKYPCDYSGFMSSGPVLETNFGYLSSCGQCESNCDETIEGLIIRTNKYFSWIVELMEKKY